MEASQELTPPEEPAQDQGPQPVMSFKSHIEGKNADVELWPDRIEWKRRSFVPLAKHDTNMVPVRMIEGVTTHRAGIRYTVVRVSTAGDVVDFSVSKYTAQAVKATLTKLIADMPVAGVAASAAPAAAPAAPATVTAAATPPEQSVADELRKLADLRDSGVLSDEEFEAQKSRLLNPPD